MQVIKRIDTSLMAALSWVLIVLLASMSCVVFANVTMRYVTGGSLVWAEEVARYAMVWLTFLGAGPVLRMGGHIAIENLQDALPRVAAQWIRAGIALTMAGLGMGMVWMGVEYMSRAQFQMTASTQISFSYIYAAIPVGGVLLLWSTVAIASGYVSAGTFEADATASGHQEGVQI
jgi:TRAP-type transport system small permease protein